ncbi:unnamed protein product [Adineta steineri]|uniref:maleylacetoacetate isomerase n=1 Tax=Adineta steineri TaxID=433720 RepID=A0A814ZLI2_9BILA|nr:unnamed protein product [Adineta steineri]CAF1243958.1 unnamed protein product [Adineta steineri]
MTTSSSVKPILYSYFRSSCSHRVRIALNLKNIIYEIQPIDLIKGEASTDEYKQINPKGEIPVLIIDGKKLTQSLPIIEYLDEIYKVPKLLPEKPYQRYQARRISEIIASGIQPLQNISVLKRVGKDKKAEWARYYIKFGLDAVEKALEESSGQYCVGNQISIADCCLMPQLYHARQWKINLTNHPLITSIEEKLNKIDAFKLAHPNQQPDCPDNENKI